MYLQSWYAINPQKYDSPFSPVTLGKVWEETQMEKSISICPGLYFRSCKLGMGRKKKLIYLLFPRPSVSRWSQQDPKRGGQGLTDWHCWDQLDRLPHTWRLPKAVGWNTLEKLASNQLKGRPCAESLATLFSPMKLWRKVHDVLSQSSRSALIQRTIVIEWARISDDSKEKMPLHSHTSLSSSVNHRADLVLALC